MPCADAVAWGSTSVRNQKRHHHDHQHLQRAHTTNDQQAAYAYSGAFSGAYPLKPKLDLFNSNFYIVVTPPIFYKTYQTASWRQRPLPAEMVQYAAIDAQVLMPLRAAIEEARNSRAWGYAWEKPIL